MLNIKFVIIFGCYTMLAWSFRHCISLISNYWLHFSVV